MRPADDAAVGDARRQHVAIDRPIDVVLDVLFARLHDLDRAVDFRRDAHGLVDVIRFEPATEAAADQMIVDRDLLGRQAGDLRGGACARARAPASRPRLRTNPAARARCSSSVPSSRGRGTAFRRRRRCARPGQVPFAASPAALATRPSFSLAARICFQTSFDDTFAFGPSSQVMSSAARPCLAAHM